LKRPIDAVQTVQDRHSGIFNFERNFIMNKTYAASIAIAFASLAAGQAMAANIDPTTGVNFDALRAAMNTPSSVTREQVKADLFAYRAAHKNDAVDVSLGTNITELRKSMAQPVVKTRQQVRAEAIATLRVSSAPSPLVGLVL
jgi:phosphotransferase system IIB component